MARFVFTDRSELVRVKWVRQFIAYDDDEELNIGNILDRLGGRRQVSGNLGSSIVRTQRISVSSYEQPCGSQVCEISIR